MENRMGIRLRFIQGMENRVGIGPRFVREMDFWVGIGFIRPLAWPFVGRMQYVPQTGDLKNGDFLFIRPLACPLVGRMQYAPTRAT